MILDWDRNQIVAFSSFTSSRLTLCYDVCRALREGKTQEKIAELFNLSDDREVRRIKKKYCPDCGNSK
jgi:hypothetical protein